MNTTQCDGVEQRQERLASAHFNPSRLRRSSRFGLQVVATVVAAVAVLAAAGCSSSGNSSAGSSNTATTSTGQPAASGSGGSGLEATTIKITNPGNVSNAALHIAIDKGLFAKQGLTVKADIDLGTGSDTEAVIGGQVDMAWSNVVGALATYSQGAPLRLVALTDYTVPNYLQVLVKGNSSIKGLADLQGKTVAVNSPQTVCVLALDAAMKKAGLDPSKVRYTTVQPPDQPTVLSAGRVDAVCSSDPTRTNIIGKLGAKSVYDTATTPLGDFAIGGYVTSASYAKAHPNTIAAFQRALAAATAMAAADPALVRSELAKYTGLPTSITDKVTLTKFATKVTDVAAVQQLADAMKTYAMTDKTISATDFVLASSS